MPSFQLRVDSNPKLVERTLTQSLNQSRTPWLKPSTNQSHLDPIERTFTQTLKQWTAPWLKPWISRAHLDSNPQPVKRNFQFLTILHELMCSFQLRDDSNCVNLTSWGGISRNRPRDVGISESTILLGPWQKNIGLHTPFFYKGFMY